jgi:hypothetical protein
MGDIVNLRRFRKARARDEASKHAETQRLAHGRSKSERQLSQAEQKLKERRLDAHKRDDG